MKGIKLLLLALTVSSLCLAQTTKLNNLNRFGKIILEGDVTEINVSRSRDGEPSILSRESKIKTSRLLFKQGL